MQMREMYTGILEKMNEHEPLLKKQEVKVAECEKAMDKAMAELESAEEEMKRLKGRYDALVKMKEAYESAFGLNSEDDIFAKTEKVEAKTEEKKPEEKKEVKSVRKGPVPQLVWKHKDARLIRMDRAGNKIGDYATQAAAARALGWDQSSVSRFMKFGRDEQLRKKNFYFMWEH